MNRPTAAKNIESNALDIFFSNLVYRGVLWPAAKADDTVCRLPTIFSVLNKIDVYI
jgi:hypothetical protein